MSKERNFFPGYILVEANLVSKEDLTKITENIDVIGIDEVQFFDNNHYDHENSNNYD